MRLLLASFVFGSVGSSFNIADFQAWAIGPVRYELFEVHRGKFTIGESDFASHSTSRFLAESLKIVDEVPQASGHLATNELSELTHRESPWVSALNGLPFRNL